MTDWWYQAFCYLLLGAMFLHGLDCEVWVFLALCALLALIMSVYNMGIEMHWWEQEDSHVQRRIAKQW